MNITTRRFDLRTIGILTLVAGVALWLWFSFRSPKQDFDIFRSANSTKTALALTAGALLGPFPTSTVPTQTPSDIPTITSTIPTATPSATRTPSPTSTFISTATPRTREPGLTSVVASTPTPRPTSTRFVPTPTRSHPTIVAPTQVVPTQLPPTQPPAPTIVIPLPTIPLIETLFP